MDEFLESLTKKDETPTVPYIVHESALAREERTIKRLWILCIIMFRALVVSNAGWIYYESQFEEVVTTETYESDAEDGGVAISNGSGEVSYNGQS